MVTFTAQGKGTWHVVKGTSKQVGKGSKVYTYTVEVEDGLESASEDQDFATAGRRGAVRSAVVDRRR